MFDEILAAVKGVLADYGNMTNQFIIVGIVLLGIFLLFWSMRR